MRYKLKKSDFVILTILLFIVSILTLVICNINWEIITLGPSEETKVRVNGHSESLDSIIHVEVIPVTTDGKIKLSRGDDWFEPEKGIGYNIKDSQIETYHYNEKTQSWDVTILENPHNGIGVDREGIIMDPPQKTLFSFASKKGFEIKIKNLSNQTVKVKVKVAYD